MGKWNLEVAVVGGFVMMMGRKKGGAREIMDRKEAPSEVGRVVQVLTLRERRMDLPLSTKPSATC
jgi:hypothetical protein